MSASLTYGELNGHMLGILMKELARRAIDRIRARRFVFQEYKKESYSSERTEDDYTDADIEAQRIYARSLRECTPEFGIIGEEENLSVPCTHPTLQVYWTVDPLDGTRAFIRRQSSGIGTMLGLLYNGKAVAGVVGDVMTQEIFYSRPGSEKVHRLSDFAKDEVLAINPDRRLQDQYLMLRDPPDKYSAGIQRVFGLRGMDMIGKSYQIDGGSIGTMMARLWKSEIGGIALRAGSATPWDMCPVVAISEKLGFVFLQPFAMNVWQIIDPTPPLIIRSLEDLLIIHRSRLDEFIDRGNTIRVP